MTGKGNQAYAGACHTTVTSVKVFRRLRLQGVGLICMCVSHYMPSVPCMSLPCHGMVALAMGMATHGMVLHGRAHVHDEASAIEFAMDVLSHSHALGQGYQHDDGIALPWYLYSIWLV